MDSLLAAIERGWITLEELIKLASGSPVDTGLTEVGKALGMSRERVRQLERRRSRSCVGRARSATSSATMPLEPGEPERGEPAQRADTLRYGAFGAQDSS
jgi:Sigma-70, region 4